MHSSVLEGDVPSLGPFQAWPLRLAGFPWIFCNDTVDTGIAHLCVL